MVDRYDRFIDTLDWLISNDWSIWSIDSYDRYVYTIDLLLENVYRYDRLIDWYDRLIDTIDIFFENVDRYDRLIGTIDLLIRSIYWLRLISTIAWNINTIDCLLENDWLVDCLTDWLIDWNDRLNGWKWLIDRFNSISFPSS